MQRPVGITHIEALGDEARRQTLAAFTVSLNREDEILTLGPDIRCARHTGSFQTPGHRFNRVVGENAEGRNNVFSEVLVLIVSPDHHEVRLELIDSNSNFLKTVQQGLTVFGCLCFSLVCSPFLLHLPWPVIRVLQIRGDNWIAKCSPENSRHVFISARKRGIVSHAETQNFTHPR